MGYTTVYGTSGMSKKAFMDRELAGSDVRIVDSAMVGSTYYAAVLSVRTGVTFGVVAIVSRKGGNLTYKVMDEDMGPHYYTCPARILDRLSPTTNMYALNWRAMCRAAKTIDKTSATTVTDGMVIRFTTPIRFTTGETLDTFRVFKTGRKVRFGVPGANFPAYRITHWQTRPFTVVS